MTPRPTRAASLAATLLVAGSLVAACGSGAASPAPADDAIRVVTTTTILADLVSEVGGSRVTVDSLVPAGGEPHTFDPSPSDVRRLADADIVFTNGLGLDAWLTDLVADAGTDAPVVALAEELEGVEYLTGGEHHHGDEADDPLAHPCKHFADEAVAVADGGSIPDDHTRYVVSLTGGAGSVTLSRDADAEVSFFLATDVGLTVTSGGTEVAPEAREVVTEGCDAIAAVVTFDLEPGDYTVALGPDAGEAVDLVWEAASHEHEGEEAAVNPHLWLNVAYAAKYAERIAEQLAVVDAAHAADYEAGGAAYGKVLADLHAKATSALGAIPEANRTVISFHGAFPYFAAAYGLQIDGTIVDAPGQDPSAGELSDLIAVVKANNVRAIFAEAQFSEDLVQTIADETGAVVVSSLYTDSVGDAPQDTYVGMMTWNIDQVATALSGS